MLHIFTDIVGSGAVHVCGRLSKDFVMTMEGRMNTLIGSSMLAFLCFEHSIYQMHNNAAFTLNPFLCLIHLMRVSASFFFLYISMRNNKRERKTFYIKHSLNKLSKYQLLL